MSWAYRRRHLVAALATAVALSLTGCSGGDDTSSPPSDASESLAEPGDAPTLQVKPVTASGRLVGRLPRKERQRVERAVSRVAVRWLEAAYVGGRYPRRSFRHAFPGFTPGARRAARADLGLLTNARIAGRIAAVTPTAIRVRVDLLAVDGRAVSGTAHVLLRYRTEGKLERRYRVAGRLMVTRHGHGWQVFGYDIARAPATPAGKQPAKSKKAKPKKQHTRKQKGERG